MEVEWLEKGVEQLGILRAIMVMIFFCRGSVIFRIHFDMIFIFLLFYRLDALLLLFLTFSLRSLLYSLIDRA